MATVKLPTKIIKSKSGHSIVIPSELWDKLDISPKDELYIYVNDNGHFEVEVHLDGETQMCERCGQKPAVRECINCHRDVCVACYWEMGGLCRSCMSK